MCASRAFFFLSVLCILFNVVVGQPQQQCDIDGTRYPCPNIDFEDWLQYRAYARAEVVAWNGYPGQGRPGEVLAALYEGSYRLYEYFAGQNARNETIEWTFPRGVLVINGRNDYIPFHFLPNGLIGRAPAPRAGSNIAIAAVNARNTIEPIVAPLLTRPTEEDITVTRFRAEYTLFRHGQRWDNVSYAFVSYDHLAHRGPNWYSEVWLWGPETPATIQMVIDQYDQAKGKSTQADE